MPDSGTAADRFEPDPSATVATLTDTAGYNAANNGTVGDVPGVTAPANYNFKGIAVVPGVLVPEPSSLALLALAGLVVFIRRR